MTCFRWTHSLETGIAKIDRQHKRLLEILRDMHERIIGGTWSDERMQDLFREFYVYAAVHFTTEEELMEKVGYPELDAHRHEHAVFRRKVRELEDAFKKGRKGVTMEVTTFMCDWLRHHISYIDKAYVRFMRLKERMS